MQCTGTSFLQKSGPNPNGDGHTVHKLIKMQYTDSSTRYLLYCGKADYGILENVQYNNRKKSFINTRTMEISAAYNQGFSLCVSVVCVYINVNIKQFQWGSTGLGI